MKFSIAKKLRFSKIGKMLFSNKITDYIIRRLISTKVTDIHYSKSNLNWIDINNKIYPILKKHACFLGHGLALSIIRNDKETFTQDLDYDTYCNDPDSLIKDLEEQSFILNFKGFVNNQLKMLTFEYFGSYIDFFLIPKENDGFCYIDTVCYEESKDYFKNNDNDWYSSEKYISYNRKISYTDINEIIWKNNKVLLPKNYDIYFDEVYGFDWKKPKKYFNWALNPKNNMPIKIKKNCLGIINKENYKKTMNNFLIKTI